ncbi:hypothetical protein [Salipiger mucosus]|uniref:Uncharacterized protein n=1 Tax=Salipiger mucosus DSM 16094 TaxID=1123237 RepID=S9QWD4_9RHOB|nr:hypothetical protein [Salipiger mucosus]EPX83928.1 hypothetical protein Salmuc_01703 [Salipiger mucosus DSM 16094]
MTYDQKSVSIEILKMLKMHDGPTDASDPENALEDPVIVGDAGSTFPPAERSNQIYKGVEVSYHGGQWHALGTKFSSLGRAKTAIARRAG